MWSLLLPILAVVLLLLVASQGADGKLHIWVFDVGQGDAVLLRTPGGHSAVIDGGPLATPLLEGVGKHIPFWQRNLDLIVLAQPQQDSITGLVDLLGRYNVGQVAQTEFTPTTTIDQVWLGALREKGTPVHYTKRGDIFTFQGEPDVALSVLNPDNPDITRLGKKGNVNNTSIVLRVQYDQISILLTGDIEKEAENNLVGREGDALESDVLLVAKHGSDTASSYQFIQTVRPKIAIISVGAGNKSGDPAQMTLDTLQGANAKIYRTDQNGTIEIIVERGRLWVRSDR